MSRFGYVMATYFASLAFGVSALFHPAPRLIWNASASTPIGLYAVQGADPLFVTELVAVRPPEPLASLLAERGYLPKGAPLLKHILALPGQTICRTGAVVTVDGTAMGQALERDRAGRPLPVWQGCLVVSTGEVFLMNWLSEDSFDGRYFGVLPAAAIVGRAEPLWTREGD
jgi:conjugative transfer signal peptidase TraF